MGSEDPADEGLDPDEIQLWIQGYTQASEEARFRDGLIHTSYYLIIIAALIVGGNLTTFLSNGETSLASVGASVLLISVGFAAIAIGWVLSTYAGKREAAANRRAQVEHELRKRDIDRYLAISAHEQEPKEDATISRLEGVTAENLGKGVLYTGLTIELLVVAYWLLEVASWLVEWYARHL